MIPWDAESSLPHEMLRCLGLSCPVPSKQPHFGGSMPPLPLQMTTRTWDVAELLAFFALYRKQHFLRL